MCFAPQRRALFRHLNFQKWSEPSVFWTFWLGNVLCAATACNFSSLIWPAGSAPAALASLLFEPPEPQIIGKTQCFATFLPFRASASSFFWLFVFSDLLSSNLSLLSPSALLCFSSVHIVGSLTSKLPSTTINYETHQCYHYEIALIPIFLSVSSFLWWTYSMCITSSSSSNYSIIPIFCSFLFPRWESIKSRPEAQVLRRREGKGRESGDHLRLRW